MLKTDYNIPIFEDTDAADLNKYSNEMAKALKSQINSTNNEIKEIDQKVVNAVSKFTEPLSYKGSVLTYEELPTTNTNGDIYTVTSENKNYIWNGTTWEEYSSNIDLTPIENQLKTIQTTQIAEALTITDCAGVNGKLDIKEGETIQEGTPTPDTPIDIRNVGNNINIFNEEEFAQNNSDYYKFENRVLTCIAVDQRSAGFNYINFKKGAYIITSTNPCKMRVYTEGNVSPILQGNNISELALNLTSDTNVAFKFFVDTIPYEIGNVKIMKGSTVKPYTPYGCGSASFKVENRNKLKLNSTVETTKNGITYSIKNGVITLNGTSTASTNLTFGSVAKLNSGNHIFSTNAEGSVISSVLGLYLYDSNNAQIMDSGNISTNLNISKQLNITNDYANLLFTCYIGNNTTFNNVVIKPMLEEGSVVSEYIEHQEQTVSFPFTEGQVLHKGDYLAEDGIHQVRRTLIINGTEDLTLNTTYNSVYLNITKFNMATGGNANIICNRLKVADKSVEGINYISSTSIYIKIDGLTTLEEYKNKFAEWVEQGNPLTIEGNVITEEITPYTEEQKEAYYQLQHLLMYEGYTSIECIDEIKPDIQVEYSYNNEINTTYGKKIDTLEARIRQLEQMIRSQSEVVK